MINRKLFAVLTLALLAASPCEAYCFCLHGGGCYCSRSGEVCQCKEKRDAARKAEQEASVRFLTALVVGALCTAAGAMAANWAGSRRQ